MSRLKSRFYSPKQVEKLSALKRPSTPVNETSPGRTPKRSRVNNSVTPVTSRPAPGRSTDQDSNTQMLHMLENITESLKKQDERLQRQEEVQNRLSQSVEEMKTHVRGLDDKVCGLDEKVSQLKFQTQAVCKKKIKASPAQSVSMFMNFIGN